MFLIYKYDYTKWDVKNITNLTSFRKHSSLHVPPNYTARTNLSRLYSPMKIISSFKVVFSGESPPVTGLPCELVRRLRYVK